MQLINYKNQTISGQYDVEINPLEIDSLENETQKMGYLLSEDALPDGIRCNMISEFEEEHGVEYNKCNNHKWSIVEMQNPEYYLSVSCSDPTEEEYEHMTMIKLSLTEAEIKNLENVKGKFCSFEGLTFKQLHAVERIVDELKSLNRQ